MPKLNKLSLQTLWDLRHLTVSELFNHIKKSPDLKFLLTGVSLWFVIRKTFSLLIAFHLLKFVLHIFSVVLA